MDEQFATTRELDQLRRDMQVKLADSATVAVLSAQMADFKTSVTSWFEGHEKLHEDAARERTAARRWLIGTAVAGFGAMAGLYGWIALLLHR